MGGVGDAVGCAGVAAGGLPCRVPVNEPVSLPGNCTVPLIVLPLTVPLKVASVVCVAMVMGAVNLMSPAGPTEALAIGAEP